MSGGAASAPSAPDESPCIASHEKHGVRVPVMCVCACACIDSAACLSARVVVSSPDKCLFSSCRTGLIRWRRSETQCRSPATLVPAQLQSKLTSLSNIKRWHHQQHSEDGVASHPPPPHPPRTALSAEEEQSIVDWVHDQSTVCD